METEEQQVEELKKWWKENASSIIVGIIIGLAMLFGGKYWLAWEESKAVQASDIYRVMLNAIQQGNNKAASDNAGVLIADYSATPYASIAAMALARFRIEDNDLAAARTQLQWVLDNSASDELRDMGRLRLVRVLIGLQEYDSAMEQLDLAEAGSGKDARLAEVRGDIYSERGETREAVTAYEEALVLMSPEYPGRNLLQLKFDQAVTLSTPSTDSPL